MSFTRRVAENILPLSSNQTTLTEALREWIYTGHCEDYGEPTVDCQMCEKEGLRYHFEIANRLTHFHLQVGSECIIRFTVAVIGPDGLPLESEEGAKVVRADRARLIEEARRQRVTAAIQAVLEGEDKEHFFAPLQTCMTWHLAEKPLSPKLMSILGWRLNVARIKHNPSDFRVALRKNKHKEDLQGFTDFKRKCLMPYLTSAQRKVLIEA